MADSLKPSGNTQVLYWVQEISAAKKREKDFRKDGERILKIYSGEKASTTPFNILFSNTETMLPALYSAIPRPVVERRFKDDDPLGKFASTAGERMLAFLIDTNVEGYETFDEAMRSATLDALLPGRGVTCEKYDAEVDEITDSVDSESPAGEDAGESKAEEAAETIPYKRSELVCSDHRSWNRVYFGYAKKWSNVPWVAFEEDIDKTEAARLFGKEVAAKLIFTDQEDTEEDADGNSDDDRDQGERKLCRIYQIWDKKARVVRYIAEQYKDDFLKVEEDPLQLTGFFNMPRPLQFMEKSNDLMPTSPYILYENQAKELNKIQIRINRIVEAIKARGVYDSELGEDIANLMRADDNALVPADKSSSLSAEKGLQNAIWFMPLDVLVTTLQELYKARESCKQVIYEITGIADIMRGASVASETLGAQEIKQQWGTLRLKRLQKEVQRYARDLLRIKLEIAATKFSEDTWAKMTGLPYLTEQQFGQLQRLSQVLQQQAQAQPPMPPADPSQPPPPNPIQDQLTQVQQKLQTPQWSQVLQLLRDDIQRAYRIDIETNSTVEPEAVEDQKNIADVMNALGQFLNSVGPLTAQGIMPFQAAQAMCLAIVRRYRFGSDIEDYIKQMQPPKQADPGAAEAAKAQAQAQADAQKAQLADQAQARAEQNDLAKEQARAQADAQVAIAKEETRRQEIAAQAAKDAAQRDTDRREAHAQRQHERAIAEKQATIDQQTELKKAALQAATQIETAIITATKSDEGGESVAGQDVASTADLMAKILARQDKLLLAIGVQ